MSQKMHRWRSRIQWTGLLGGPALALLVSMALPDQYRGVDGTIVEFTQAGQITLAVMAWMACWWITEAVDISTTALLPLVLFPLLGAAGIEEAAAPFAHPLIFLFMGGFLIAISMQRWGLDRRIALLTLRVAGTRPSNMVAGFMVTTAALSAFVSNTATTAMMVPIALSVVALVRGKNATADPEEARKARNLALCLLLGIAYAASIGGICTIIGTPPNAWLVAFVRDEIAPAYRTDITFVRWLSVGLPVTMIMLPVTWFLLTRFLYPLDKNHIRGGGELIRVELKALGRAKPGERVTLAVFAATALTWIFQPLLVKISWTWGEQQFFPLAGLSDPGIAMTGAMALFVIPIDVRRRVFTLDWSATKDLPWGILILFGGGLSLASAVRENGVAQFIASASHRFADMPAIVIVVIVTAMVIFLTELTSNLATTAALVPLLAAMAPGMGLHPFLLILPATLAASCAFMMPVATPPNAIVFGSGEVRIAQMMKAGIWLNLIGIAVVTALAMQWFPRLFGIG